MPELAFECKHIRIMFCEFLTEENRLKMDEFCNTCYYHRPKDKQLFCLHRKPMETPESLWRMKVKA